MAGDWIKIEHTTPDKPEVVKLSNVLNIDQDAVVGKLIRVWIWADQNSVNGNDVSVTDSFLDRLTFCNGFSVALRNVGWLTGRNGCLMLPNFDRHNGQTSKSRAVTNRRVAKHRSGCNEMSVTNVTDEALEKPLPEKRREENLSATPSHEVERCPKSIEEVEHFMANQVMKPLEAEVHECASKFFDEMEAIGWRNKRGIPLDKWQPLARQYAANWARNTAESNFQSARGSDGKKMCNNGSSRKGNVRTDNNDLGVKWE